MSQPVIAQRRVFNVGNFETIAIELSWTVADPDKTLRSPEEEFHLARLYLARMICKLAVQEILRIHNYRQTQPHPNIELREFALTATTYTYNQCIQEIKIIEAEMASLEVSSHTYGPDGSQIPQ